MGNAGECPSPGCRELRDTRYMACKTHWFQLPKEMRDRIWSLGRTPFRTAQTVAGYRAAVRAAIQYLKERA